MLFNLYPWIVFLCIFVIGLEQMQVKNRESSVIVQPSWKIIEEMDFPRLGKLSLRLNKEPQDL